VKTKIQKDINDYVKNPILRISIQILLVSVLILIFLWFIDSAVSNGEVYLDVEIENNQIQPDTIYMAKITDGGRYEYEDTIPRDKLMSILENILVKQDLNISKGRQIWRLLPYTTGSPYRDFFPFFSYNDNYVLYEISTFEEDVNYDNQLGRYFSPYGLQTFLLGLIIVFLFILAPLLLFQLLLSFNPPYWLSLSILIAFFLGLVYIIYWNSFYFYGIRPFLKGMILHVYFTTSLVSGILKIRKYYN
jgi:hypothetical protein